MRTGGQPLGPTAGVARWDDLLRYLHILSAPAASPAIRLLLTSIPVEV